MFQTTSKSRFSFIKRNSKENKSQSYDSKLISLEQENQTFASSVHFNANSLITELSLL